MASLLPELESEVDAFKVTDPTVGQESAELAVPKMLGKYQTAIELQAIQAPDGKVNDHKKLLEIIRAGESSTTVVLMEKAIAFCNDKTETWLDVAFANKTKPRHESTEQLVAKGLFPGAVALPEPSRASQSPAAFECSQALEGTPPLFSEVRRDSLCPHDG